MRNRERVKIEFPFQQLIATQLTPLLVHFSSCASYRREKFVMNNKARWKVINQNCEVCRFHLQRHIHVRIININGNENENRKLHNHWWVKYVFWRNIREVSQRSIALYLLLMGEVSKNSQSVSTSYTLTRYRKTFFPLSTRKFKLSFQILIKFFKFFIQSVSMKINQGESCYESERIISWTIIDFDFSKLFIFFLEKIIMHFLKL